MGLNALGDAGRAIASGITAAAGNTARAAANANAISAGAQAAQGTFNQNSVNLANSLGNDRLAQQWQWNSAGAQMANDYTSEMWQKTADWNEDMFSRSMEFNAMEAQKQRDWLEHMRDTAYQAARKDMEAAGLNPILAVTGGGIQTGGGGGAQASIGMPSMSSASGAMPSGGLLNGLAASEGNYSGQMEYMGGLLGLLSAGVSGLSTAFKAMSSSNEVRVILENMADGVLNFKDNYNNMADYFNNGDPVGDNAKSFSDYWKQGRKNQGRSDYVPNYRNGIDWNIKSPGYESY